MPPFSGCRSQRARTLVETSTGRVFEQNRLVSNVEFFPYAYACDFETNRRVTLGRDWDDEQIDVPRQAGALVAFARVGCGVGSCGASIKVLDLRDGHVVATGAGAPGPPFGPHLVRDLVLKENGSVAWTVGRGSFGDPGYFAQELWVRDGQGERLLDSGAGLDPTSLTLTDSTLTWINGGVVRSATLS